MSKLSLIAATAFLATAGAFAAAPSLATEPTTGIISGSDAAASVCLTFNEYGPTRLEKVSEDGLGDWIVWVRDKDNDLWMCNASAEGNVYANTLIRGDLLKGAGERAIALVPVSVTPPRLAEAEKAERLCAAAGRKVDATRIVTTVEDGVGDYIVWLEDSAHSYWVCNASAKAELFVFEHIRAPLNSGASGPEFRAA